MKEAQFYWR